MRVLFNLLLLAFACNPVQAQQAAGKSGAAGQDFIDLLEFLGEFTTEDGDWIDPEEVENAATLADEEDEESAGTTTTARPPVTGARQEG
jgi:hypothetical protein